jgi:hypothetical protein
MSKVAAQAAHRHILISREATLDVRIQRAALFAHGIIRHYPREIKQLEKYRSLSDPLGKC